MTQWFHRNPLKATTRLDFDLGLVATNIPARRLCSDLTIKRGKLLQIISDTNITQSTMLETVQQYISYLIGFCQAPPEIDHGDSKIRYAKKVKWHDSLTVKGEDGNELQDFYFELGSMLINVGFWFSKHAAKISSKENVNIDEAKVIHKSLKHAAALLKHVKSDIVPKLDKEPGRFSDMDPEILDAYINQFTAEAQEVTMAQAIELEHAASLISALAYETSKLYENARLSLKNVDDKKAGKWKMYLTFKELCYLAYAYCYHTDTLLAANKGGEAVVSGKNANDYFEKAIVAAREYHKANGVGLTIKPAEHLFFRNLGPLCKRMHSKAVRENDMIYHEKIPTAIPDIQLKATFGLAAPVMPELNFDHHEDWKQAYGGFDEKKLLLNVVEQQEQAAKSKGKGPEEQVEPVVEKPIYSTDKDPTNKSGCIVS